MLDGRCRWCHPADESNCTVQKFRDDWWRFWIVCQWFNGESNFIEHVSGVGIATWCVAEGQEVIINKWCHKAGSSPREKVEEMELVNKQQLVCVEKILTWKLRILRMASKIFPRTQLLSRYYAAETQQVKSRVLLPTMSFDRASVDRYWVDSWMLIAHCSAKWVFTARTRKTVYRIAPIIIITFFSPTLIFPIFTRYSHQAASTNSWPSAAQRTETRAQGWE